MNKSYATIATGVVIVALVVGVGVLKTTGLLDGDTSNTAISTLLGFLGGGAIGMFGRRS